MEGKLVEQRRFSVYFASDQLAKWEGDKAPPARSYRIADTGTSGEAKSDDIRKEPPKIEEKSFFEKLREKLGF